VQARPFNQRLHSEVDRPSREAVKTYFNRQGLSFYDNPDKYGIDLLSPCGEQIEIEHRTSFKEVFSFPTVNIPARKEKFLKANPSCSYAVVNDDYTRLGIVPGWRVQLYLENVWENGGEYFFKIPQNEFLWDRIN
jgi:hypothetical protein